MNIYEKLQKIGLSRREAEVYIALLQKNEFTAPELTKLVAITRTKIYEVLQNLVRKGMCNEKIKNGQKAYKAIKPSIIFQNVAAEVKQEIEQLKKETKEKKEKVVEGLKEKFSKELKEKINSEEKKIDAAEQKIINAVEQKKRVALSLEKELEALHKNGAANFETLDYVEVLTDRNQINNRWIELQRKTKFEMLGFNKSPYSIKHAQNAPYQEEMLRNKKIKGRAIYECGDISSESSLDEFISVVELYSNLGEESRVIKTLPMKMVVIDEAVTMLALNDPISMKASITTIIITHPHYALANKQVFESFWVNSVPIQDFKKNPAKYIANNFNIQTDDTIKM